MSSNQWLFTFPVKEISKLRRLKREKTLKERGDECKAIEISSHAAGMVADVAGDINSIPIIGDFLGIFTAGVAMVSHVTKSGLDIAATALDCADVPFDEIKEILDKKFNEVDRKLDKNTAALDKVSKLVSQTLLSVEKTRVEMNEGFNAVLESIESTTIKAIISKINNFVEYFNGERERIRGLPKDEYVAKLLEENSILSDLKDTRTPKADSLRSPLFEIIDNDYAIPADADDGNALRTLFALYYGTQTYISIMFFLLEQHSYLADYHYQNGDIEEFNNEFDKIKIIFEDFKFSLIGGSTGNTKSLVDEVIEILNIVLEQDFIKNQENNLYNEISGGTENLLQLRNQIKEMDLPLIEDTPKTAAQISLQPPNIKTPIGGWEDGTEVRYAVQYFKNGVYSKVSEWSKPFKVRGKANPSIKIPIDPRKRDRLVFRMFNHDKPQLIGVMTKSQTDFKDINRDLYNAVGGIDKDIALKEVETLIKNGADFKATFEGGRSSIHAAALSGNVKIALRFLLKNGSTDINKKDLNGYTPLHISAEAGQAGFVKLLISRKADVNAKTNSNLFTPLHLASRNGFVKTVQNLLQSQTINVNEKDESGFTALHIAIMSGVLVVEALMSHKDIDVNIKSETGLSPLHMAIMNDDREVVETLMKSNKLDLNSIDVNSMTPLHFASMVGMLKMVKYLLSLSGINVNAAAAGNKWTPLHFAIFFKKEDVALELINSKSVDLEFDADGNVSPLHIAVATGQLNIITELLSRGAKIEEETNDGYTPLHIAAIRKEQDIAAVLIEKGADIEAKTNDNKTPLHLAAGSGRKETVLNLLQKGANIRVYDEERNTPLHDAVLNNNIDIVQILIEQDSSLINERNDDEQSPLHLAAENYYTEIFSYLVLNGADVNAKNRDGMTPLVIFAEEGDLDMVQLLINNGADVNDTNNDGLNFFYLAVRNGHFDIVQYVYENNIIDFSADDRLRVIHPNDHHNAVYWAVCDAIAYDKYDIVEYFVGTLNKKVCNPLQYAAQYGHLDIVQYLVEDIGMDVNESSPLPWPETPLCNAVWNAHLDVIKYLIEKKVAIDANCSNYQSALLFAIQRHQIHIVKYLVQHGANPRRTDMNGNMPLHYTAMFGNLESAKYLIEVQYVDVNGMNFGLDTALHIAAENGFIELVDYFVSKGGNLLAGNEFGQTPLLLATPEVIEYVRAHNLARIGRSIKVQQRVTNSFMDSMGSNKNKSPSIAAIEPENKYNSLEYISSKTAEVNQFSISSLASPKSNNYFKRAESNSVGSIDSNGMLLLLDILIRKFTNEKYKAAGNESVSKIEAQAVALDIMEKFEELINEVSNVPAGEQIDMAEVHSNIYKAIMSGNESKISKILCSYVKTISELQPQEIKKLIGAYMTTKPTIMPSNSQYHEQIPNLLLNTCLANGPAGSGETHRIE